MKRIRVELDASDDSLPWWLEREGSGQFNLAGCPVRSVEVVEPERWTELVLRRATALKREEGDVVFLAAETSPHVQQSWTVASCTEREEYPNG